MLTPILCKNILRNYHKNRVETNPNSDMLNTRCSLIITFDVIPLHNELR